MMKKLCIHLRDGLANQLFKIASGYGIAKRSKRQLVFDEKYMDKTHCKEHDDLIRKIILEHFSLESMPANTPYFSLGAFAYVNDLNCYPQDCLVLNGGFANEANFIEYKNDILSIFSRLCPGEIINETIGFHFRLGDFLHWQKGTWIISQQYIHDSVGEMLDKGAARKIDVFTENPDIALKNIVEALSISPRIENVDINFPVKNDLDTFLEMTKYHYFIASRSTFSWWSSFLHQKMEPDQYVCFPNKTPFYKGKQSQWS